MSSKGSKKKTEETVVGADLAFIGEDPVEADDESLAPPEPYVPSLHEAFVILADAVTARLEDFPDIFFMQEVRKRYADGNHVLAWKQVIATLEGVIGEPIRQ